MGNGVGLGGTGSDWGGTRSDWGEWGQTGGEQGRIGGNGVGLGGNMVGLGRTRSDWGGMGIGLVGNGVGLGGGLDKGIRRGPAHLAPLFASNCAQTACLYMKRGRTGCMGQGEPFEGRNSWKGIIVLNGLLLLSRYFGLL